MRVITLEGNILKWKGLDHFEGLTGGINALHFALFFVINYGEWSCNIN